jgi:hypothetical protein
MSALAKDDRLTLIAICGRRQPALHLRAIFVLGRGLTWSS